MAENLISFILSYLMGLPRLHRQKFWSGKCWFLFGALSWTLILPQGGVGLPQVRAEEIFAFCWPAGFFYRLGRLTLAERERVSQEIDLRLESLRRQKGMLLVKGEVVGSLSPTVPIYPVVTILDQSGLLVQVRNFPNLFQGLPESTLRLHRNTFLVARNPQLDLLESRIRQQWVISADFVAFSGEYLEALSLEGRQRAPAFPQKQLPGRSQMGRKELRER